MDLGPRTGRYLSFYDEVEEIEATIRALDKAADVPPEIEESIDALAERESGLVDADIECADELNLDEHLRQIRHRLEAEAVAENGNRRTVMLNADE